MANAMASYVNRADGATLSGGSWLVQLPLANMQDTRLSLVARSANLLVTTTKFDIDLGDEHVVRLVALVNHTISQAATIRITAGDTVGATAYDSGWVDAWRPSYSLLDRDFEEDDWWTGWLSEEERALYPAKAVHDCGANLRYRYWRIEISDTTNPAGYIDIARLWLGPVWQPTINYDWGAALVWQPRDRAIVTRSGARLVERMRPQRVFRLTLHELTDQEAFGRALEMNRSVGAEGEILFIPDPDDRTNEHRRNILGRVASWGDGAAEAAYGKQTISFTVEERL